MVTLIKVEGIGKVKNMVNGVNRNLPKAINRGINKFTNRLEDQLRKEAKIRGHVNTGYLSSVGTFARKSSENIWEIKMPKSTIYLEKGTKPHWIPRKYITELWARRHGMSFYRFKSIVAEYGTRPHPFTQSVITREIHRLKSNIEKETNKTMNSKGRR